MPILFGAVTAGIILVFGAEAVGISLRYHILHFLGVPGTTPENPSGSPSAKEQNEQRKNGTKKLAVVNPPFIPNDQGMKIKLRQIERLKRLNKKFQVERDQAYETTARLKKKLEEKELADTSRYAVNSPPVDDPKKPEEVGDIFTELVRAGLKREQEKVH